MTPSSPTRSRRRFLQHLAVLGAAGTGAGWLTGCTPGSDASSPLTLPPGADLEPSDEPAGRLTPGAVDGRILVVVDLLGGNDGLSTLVPLDDSRYFDLRPDLAITDALAIDGRVGLNPSLSRLHERGLTTVEGVGAPDGDLSHFAMTERWEQGDVAGTSQMRNGFLGRVTDALDDGSPLVGVSMGGPTPHLINQRAATLSLSGVDSMWFLEPSDWEEAAAYQRLLRGFDMPAYDRLLDLADRLGATEEPEADWDDPMLSEGGDLGWQLHVAADLIEADVGTRVIYTQLGGFDTHDGHQWQHPQLMGNLDAALDGFLRRIEDQAKTDQVLVATVSEFGRRVEENGGGLDHGAASTMLLAGPTEARQLGEAPPLDELDENGNLAVTISFDRYLGSLAEEWLGVEAASVLPTDPELLGLI